MSNRVKIGNLAATVMKQLDEYSGLCSANMKEAVKKTAKTVKQDISANAPERYGHYKKSWDTKNVLESQTKLEITVHSRNRYQLAHLLEFGHALRNGGRSKAFPHIAPAEERGVKMLETEIERSLRGE